MSDPLTLNRAIIDYNTIYENLQMERLQHSQELAALQVKYDEALERIDELERDIKDLLYEANRNDF